MVLKADLTSVLNSLKVHNYSSLYAMTIPNPITLINYVFQNQDTGKWLFTINVEKTVAWS